MCGDDFADAADEMPVWGELAPRKERFEPVDDAVQRAEEITNLTPVLGVLGCFIVVGHGNGVGAVHGCISSRLLISPARE